MGVVHDNHKIKTRTNKILQLNLEKTCSFSIWKDCNTKLHLGSNHLAQWNLFDVVNSAILKFPAVVFSF